MPPHLEARPQVPPCTIHALISFPDFLSPKELSPSLLCLDLPELTIQPYSKHRCMTSHAANTLNCQAQRDNTQRHVTSRYSPFKYSSVVSAYSVVGQGGGSQSSESSVFCAAIRKSLTKSKNCAVCHLSFL